MRRTILLLFLAHALFTASAVAQIEPPATIEPPVPTQYDQIRATFEVPGPCLVTESITVTGTTIREDLRLSCIIGPPPFPANYSSVFGPLPPNTYTYEIYYDFQNGQPPTLRSRQTIVVSASTAPIPALSPTLLAVLTLSFAIIAFIALGRSS